MDVGVARWVSGLAFSLVLGQFATWAFLATIRRASGLGSKPGSENLPKRLAPWLTGTVERLVFTIFVAAYPSAALGPMVGWLALKLATNWNHPHWKEDPQIRTWAMSALLAGLVSMLFAFVGGQIAAGRIYVGI